MTPDALDLARRLAAVLPMPSMNVRHYQMRQPVLSFRDRNAGMRWICLAPRGAPTRDWAPDLDDAATCGALLDVARERWGDPDLFIDVCWDDGSRHVHRRGKPGDNRGHCLPGTVPKWALVASGPTDGAAIAQAILAAPTLATTPPPAPWAAS